MTFQGVLLYCILSAIIKDNLIENGLRLVYHKILVVACLNFVQEYLSLRV